MCGEESGVFSLGNCGLRWAFVLACIALCDAVILGKQKEYLRHSRIFLIFRLPGLHPGCEEAEVCA